ncbi:MAG: hypothetical protein ACRDV0_01740 [Acidimicrobiales bacterium]
MEAFEQVKATNDFYDDVHYRRTGGRDTTLCGLRVTGATLTAEVSCQNCRRFAQGDF